MKFHIMKHIAMLNLITITTCAPAASDASYTKLMD
jgi:hypothetical protein